MTMGNRCTEESIAPNRYVFIVMRCYALYFFITGGFQFRHFTEFQTVRSRSLCILSINI